MVLNPEPNNNVVKNGDGSRSGSAHGGGKGQDDNYDRAASGDGKRNSLLGDIIAELDDLLDDSFFAATNEPEECDCSQYFSSEGLNSLSFCLYFRFKLA